MNPTEAVGWIANALISSLISGAGFYCLSVGAEYAKTYYREQQQKELERFSEELIKIEALQGWKGRTNSRSSIRLGKINGPANMSPGASIFAAYKMSAAFLSCTPNPKSTGETIQPSFYSGHPLTRYRSFSPASNLVLHSSKDESDNSYCPRCRHNSRQGDEETKSNTLFYHSNSSIELSNKANENGSCKPLSDVTSRNNSVIGSDNIASISPHIENDSDGIASSSLKIDVTENKLQNQRIQNTEAKESVAQVLDSELQSQNSLRINKNHLHDLDQKAFYREMLESVRKEYPFIVPFLTPIVINNTSASNGDIRQETFTEGSMDNIVTAGPRSNIGDFDKGSLSNNVCASLHHRNGRKSPIRNDIAAVGERDSLFNSGNSSLAHSSKIDKYPRNTPNLILKSPQMKKSPKTKQQANTRRQTQNGKNAHHLYNYVKVNNRNLTLHNTKTQNKHQYRKCKSVSETQEVNESMLLEPSLSMKTNLNQGDVNEPKEVETQKSKLNNEKTKKITAQCIFSSHLHYGLNNMQSHESDHFESTEKEEKLTENNASPLKVTKNKSPIERNKTATKNEYSRKYLPQSQNSKCNVESKIPSLSPNKLNTDQHIRSENGSPDFDMFHVNNLRKNGNQICPDSSPLLCSVCLENNNLPLEELIKFQEEMLKKVEDQNSQSKAYEKRNIKTPTGKRRKVSTQRKLKVATSPQGGQIKSVEKKISKLKHERFLDNVKPVNKNCQLSKIINSTKLGIEKSRQLYLKKNPPPDCEQHSITQTDEPLKGNPKKVSYFDSRDFKTSQHQHESKTQYSDVLKQGISKTRIRKLRNPCSTKTVNSKLPPKQNGSSSIVEKEMATPKKNHFRKRESKQKRDNTKQLDTCKKEISKQIDFPKHNNDDNEPNDFDINKVDTVQFDISDEDDEKEQINLETAEENGDQPTRTNRCLLRKSVLDDVVRQLKTRSSLPSNSCNVLTHCESNPLDQDLTHNVSMSISFVSSYSIKYASINQ